MDKAIVDKIRRLKEALELQGIKSNRIILYGSQVSGRAKKHSDIDIVVISDDFKGMNILERLETTGLALAKAKIMEPIEPLGYTEEEFSAKGKGTFIGDEVKTKGVEVK